MGLDSFQTEGPRTYTEDTSPGPSIEDERVHVPKGEEVPEGLLPDTITVHRIVMKEQTMKLKLPGGGPYFVCGDCGKVSTSPESIVKTDKLEHREQDWKDEFFDWLLDEVKPLSESDWEERCDTELPDYQSSDDNEEEDDGDETTDTSSGSGLDSFMT